MKLMDPSFSYVDASESQLKSLWQSWHRGALLCLLRIGKSCVLLENIAYMRGFDVSKWGETYEITQLKGGSNGS